MLINYRWTCIYVFVLFVAAITVSVDASAASLVTVQLPLICKWLDVQRTRCTCRNTSRKFVSGSIQDGCILTMDDTH